MVMRHDIMVISISTNLYSYVLLCRVLNGMCLSNIWLCSRVLNAPYGDSMIGNGIARTRLYALYLIVLCSRLCT